MSKERLRLKEFRNYVDFLDKSQDIQDHGRFIDTLQALYEDGWFDWIYLYAREQTERVEELEEINIDAITQIDVTQKRNERLEKRVQELEDKLARIRFVNSDYDKINKRYREALELIKRTNPVLVDKQWFIDVANQAIELNIGMDFNYKIDNVLHEALEDEK